MNNTELECAYTTIKHRANVTYRNEANYVILSVANWFLALGN